MADSTTALLPIAILLLLSGTIAIFYLWHRLRMKRQAPGEPRDPRGYTEDRAHNQIRLTEAAADRLESQGVDVSRVRDLLRQADERMLRRDFDGALGLARSAQQSLGKLREASSARPWEGATAPSPATAGQGPSEGAAPALPPTRLMAAAARASAGPDPPDPPPTEEAEPPAARVRLPKNRIESQFQLKMLGVDLDRAGAGAPAAGRAEAERFRSEAQGAFDRGDYTEALRLALKGRRTLGTRLETLPPPTAAPAVGSAPGPAPPPTAPPEGPGGRMCSGCGMTNDPADRFCRGCGRPLASGTCARCGQPLRPQDRFCGSCGATVS